MDLRAPHVLRRVRADPAVDMREAVEAADGREPTVDGGRGQLPGLEGAAEELDVRAGRFEDLESDVGRPLEEGPQVVSVRLKRPAAVAGQECRSGQLGFIELVMETRQFDRLRRGVNGGHGSTSLVVGRSSQLHQSAGFPPADSATATRATFDGRHLVRPSAQGL